MAKLNALTHSFSQGEVSAAALARVDQERLRLAAEVQENLLPHVIGKGLVRPGTVYIGATASNNKSRLIPFVKSPTDTALLEFSSALLRIMISDTMLTRPSVTSTVTNGSFSFGSGTITVTIASPGVVTWTTHGFSGNEPIVFTTTGALPTGLTAGTIYYVRASGLTANTFTVSATAGGAAINTSGTQSGTHTGYYGWTPTFTTGATVAITGGALELQASARGSSAYVDQAVTTSSGGTEHALRVTVTRGPVQFRVGSTSGAEDYITETSLDTGIHSLAFTPSGTYHIRITNRTDRKAIVDSVAVESSGVVTLAAPWSESDLPLIRHAQSIDTVFLACQSWQQRKIERRGSTGRSWSLVKYETEDGPFITAETNNVRISANGSYGLVTLTSSANLFSSSQVGSLLQVQPSGYAGTFLVAGEDQYCDAIRLYGAGTDITFLATTTGTWVGTLTVQFSLDGPFTGFTDMQPGVALWSKTSNHSAQTFNVDSAYNNVPVWVRMGFKSGQYTSGSASITLTYGGSGRAGVYRITAYSSATSVEAQVLSAPGSTASTDVWSWGAWSDVNGWPSAVGFFDGRLFWGGADKFWGSESDNYYAFNLDDEGASGSIQRALATGGTINRIKWLLPLQRLIFGSDGAEISARSSSFDEPLTPTNVTLKDAATQGVAAITPVKVDGRGFYVHRDGLRLFEISYDVESNDYRVGSIMLLNDTIGGTGTGFLELAVQRSPESYVWTVRSDGVCPVLIYDPKEKTAGWFKFIAAPSAAGDAVVESIAILPTSGQDRVYMAVKRTINGSVVRYIEKLAKHSEARGDTTTKMGDSGVTNAGPVTTFTGLSHLIGETVVAWGTTGGVTGPIGTTYTVNGSGEITLPSSSTNVTVGLAYTWRYKSAKLAFGTEGGTSLLRPKRVAELGLLLGVHHPNAIQYGPDFSTMYYMPRVEDGQDVTTTTVRSVYDEKAFAFGGGWDTDSRVCLKGSAPYPAEIFALVTSIEVGAD